ncbi:MAG: Uma2 family endonuclease [Caldilineaceae bacterium]|nr:Uma2 family endonuclease [Caldilineaceae bacterium]
MTVLQSTVAELQPPALLPLPDPPRRNPDELMANFQHLTINGGALHLAKHFGNPDTTLLGGDLYLAPFPPDDMAGIRYPDMLIAFDVDPEAYHRRNAYIISEQGKPPDFVLEIGSPSTGRVDVEEKRDDYAALGIPEYWRFDETGLSHGTRLAGDRLVDGVYQPIAIEELEEDILQGHSAVLNLDLRWEQGQLKWHDPETGWHIATYDDQVARADQAETALRAEREARAALEAKVRELEAQLRRPDSRSR